jgi:hypothetical protein
MRKSLPYRTIGAIRMSVALDLFIQDFINTNKLLNSHYSWPMLCSRRLMEHGSPRVFEFVTSGEKAYATGQYCVLPDADYLRITLTHSIPAEEELRFDYLRMLSVSSHTSVQVEKIANTLSIALTTRHRGFLNVVFLIRDQPPITHPFLAVA